MSAPRNTYLGARHLTVKSRGRAERPEMVRENNWLTYKLTRNLLLGANSYLHRTRKNNTKMKLLTGYISRTPVQKVPWLKTMFCLKNITLFEVVSLHWAGTTSVSTGSASLNWPGQDWSSITEIFQYQNGDINNHRSLMTVESCILSTRTKHTKYWSTQWSFIIPDALMKAGTISRVHPEKLTHKS